MNDTLTWKYLKGENLALRGASSYQGLRVLVSAFFLTLAIGIYAASQDPIYLWFLLPLAIACVLLVLAFRKRGGVAEATYTFRPDAVEILQDNRTRTIPLKNIRWYSLYGDNSLSVYKPATVRKIAADTQEEGKLPLTVIYLKLRGSAWSVPVYANADMHTQATAWLQAHGIRHSSNITGKLRPSGKYFRIAFFVFMGLLAIFSFVMAIFFQE